ncbi:putative C6 transcription factor [Talaromyces proteolyticus]|uniref:C6 transcription factor n=1 Tax=Talaromyces proteolyticus TaxID=1131652 RepID=A0AAD4KU44_9EURO|nr:putative C6 transcription factor [Talaromyces proteolyticus]KAH8699248.1 putative C6 transcription factor [Talaromyces proteolyticus]
MFSFHSESATTRRNGKPQSCEPCRKSKLRCDHTRPVCDRCTARNMVQHCFYHPSPMTKRPAPGNTGVLTKSQGDASYRSDDRYRIHKVLSPSSAVSSPALAAHLAPTKSPRLELATSPGYLGSTSYSAVLAEHQKDIPIDSETPMGTVSAAVDPERAQAGFRVLALLYNLTFLDHLITRSYAKKWYRIYPSSVIEKIISSTRRVYDSFEATETETRLSELAVQVFRNSFRPIPRSKTMTVDEYTDTFTGENMRWETIALILALAGNSVLACYEQDPIFADLKGNGDNQKGSAEVKDQLLSQVSDATSTCLTFCDHAASSNEILAYAQYTDVVMKTQQYGDSSYQAWRRLSELSATVYASGLHKIDGPADENCPFFLKQLRRSCFAAAFFVDKSEATFVGRPPLINFRYCSLALPYDIDDEVLLTPGDAEQEVLKRVDVNGWDKDGIKHRTSIIRIRLQLSVCREEILELALGDGYQRDVPRKAEAILERARKAWEQCPAHLRYDYLSQEDLNHPLYDQHMGIFLLYVDYLHSHFLLHRTVVKYTEASPKPLFDTARILLSTVLRICNDREATTDRSKQVSWIVLYYGLPSACVLAFEVLRQTQNPEAHRLPSVHLPRSEIIRNLSVFVSCLAWVASPSPSHGNYAVCKEVEQKLSHILDQILDPPRRISAPVEDLSFVQNFASGLEGYLDWNQFNNNAYDFNSDYFAF